MGDLGLQSHAVHSEHGITRKAIENLDFLIVVDVLPSETAGWADLVLPECTYLERYDDLHAPNYREPYVAFVSPSSPHYIRVARTMTSFAIWVSDWGWRTTTHGQIGQRTWTRASTLSGRACAR